MGAAVSVGKNGAVQVPLFTTPVPQNGFAVSGSVGVPDTALLKQIQKHPAGLYANLYTAEGRLDWSGHH
ncbi:CHRD domain-containing protein [Streptomyces sp. NPDC005820]|uniref:CHRD domain-containing protein n=1 Tax=Streptomyces sp. NPDC005820 TaxID=3157069 RepID=UPI0033C3D05A